MKLLLDLLSNFLKSNKVAVRLKWLHRSIAKVVRSTLFFSLWLIMAKLYQEFVERRNWWEKITFNFQIFSPKKQSCVYNLNSPLVIILNTLFTFSTFLLLPSTNTVSSMMGMILCLCSVLQTPSFGDFSPNLIVQFFL